MIEKEGGGVWVEKSTTTAEVWAMGRRSYRVPVGVHGGAVMR